METGLAIVAVWFVLILLVAPLAGKGLALLGESYPEPYDWDQE